jgi:excisionase family DNA binding protein
VTPRRPLAGDADPTTAGVLRDHLAAALASAMRRPEPDAIALTADRVKAMAVALAGADDLTEVRIGTLEVGTQGAATILGYHPEHVRRLIRTAKLRARRVGGDYRLRVDDLWPLIEARYREPGRRRIRSAR